MLSNQLSNDRLLTASEVREFLALPSIDCVYTKVCRRELPYFRIGKRAIRFRLSDLERWLADRREEPIPDNGAAAGGGA